MSDPIYKNSINLGNGKSDVIISTAGKVIVKVKDRYYTLNYNNSEKSEEKVKENEVLTDLILLKTDSEVETIINTLTKNSIIITSENTMYLYLDGTIYPFDFSSTGNTVFNDLTVNNKLEINGIISIKNASLVQNLNAQYLNGNSSEVFITINLPQTITETWTFTNTTFFNKSISDTAQKTLLDFETSSLVIDNITVKNLTIISDENSEEEDSNDSTNIEIDYIKKQTYLGEGSKIISSDEMLKEEVNWNENWENGGDSIVELIINAVNDEKLSEHYTNDEDDSYSYYVNMLLDTSTNSSFTSLITVTEDMFYEDDSETLPYKSYYYRPKNVDTIWVNTPYDESSNAKIGIYDNWFDKNNYTTELANFKGLVWNIELSNNPYKIGEKVKYETEFSTIYGLVTKSSEKKIVIITNSEDCDVLYDPNSEEYDTCYINYTPITGSVLLPAVGGQSVIGNITNIENSIFGTLSGYGFTSEGNCYFVNPGIALVNTDNLNYLKLYNKEQSFIGINKKNEKWITIETDGGCDMRRDKMYNINNHLSFCSFGPIRVEEDGSATIGSGETQITITADGKVQIPEACIIK